MEEGVFSEDDVEEIKAFRKIAFQVILEKLTEYDIRKLETEEET